MGIISDFRYRRISRTATVNDLLKEFFRKLIHIAASIVPVFAGWDYRLTVFGLSAVLFAYMVCEYLRLIGHPVPVVSRLIAYASRKRDVGRFVLGPVTMAFGVLATLVLFPPEAATVGIFALAFGDGVASLVGKTFGRFRPRVLRGKSVEGSVACFVAVYVSAALATDRPLAALIVAFVATFIEALPIRDYDNLFIPVVSALAFVLLP